MTTKNVIVEFLSFIFFISLLIFVYYFFIVGERVEDLGEILLTFVPIAIFIMLYLFVFNFRRREMERRREDNNDEIALYLDLRDKLIADILPFVLSVGVILFAWFSFDKINKFDIMSSLFVFFIVMSWHSYIFKKE